jgi:hypothetical protein
LVRALRANKANFEKLWQGVSDCYDQNFKNKLYNEILFRVLIFDVLQLNIYHYENNVNSLYNSCDNTDERLWQYSNLTRDFLVTCKHYLEMFKELFEKSIGGIKIE